MVAQRLVRSICLSCKEEAEADPALIRRLGLQAKEDQLKFFRGKGCDKCSFTGYRGRIGIFELLRVNQEMTPLIMEKADERYRGRVMSIFMLNFGLMPLGVLPAGILADYVGGQAVVGALGLLLIGITALVLVTQKQLRRVQ